MDKRQITRVGKKISASKKLKIVMIEIGAGAAIPTTRRESEKISKEFSCPLIRVNLEHPSTDDRAAGIEHVRISGDAEEALSRINKQINILVRY